MHSPGRQNLSLVQSARHVVGLLNRDDSDSASQLDPTVLCKGGRGASAARCGPDHLDGG